MSRSILRRLIFPPGTLWQITGKASHLLGPDPSLIRLRVFLRVTCTRSFFSLANPRVDYTSKVGSRLIALFIGLNWPRKEIDDVGFSYTIKADKFPSVNRATELSSAKVYEAWTLKSLHIRGMSWREWIAELGFGELCIGEEGRRIETRWETLDDRKRKETAGEMLGDGENAEMKNCDLNSLSY